MGAEGGHQIIKEHGTKAVLEMREGKGNSLLKALGEVPRFPLGRADLEHLMSDPIEFTGDARQQVKRVIARIEKITSANPTAASYTPGGIR